jgi:hypothetical protein
MIKFREDCKIPKGAYIDSKLKRDGRDTWHGVRYRWIPDGKEDEHVDAQRSVVPGG